MANGNDQGYTDAQGLKWLRPGVLAPATGKGAYKSSGDSILDEIRGGGGGTAVAEEDPILAEIHGPGQEEKRKKEETYPVAPLEGTSNLFPSPQSRTAIPESLTEQTLPPKETVKPVRGKFGEPEFPQVVQQEVNKAKLARDTATMKELDKRAAQTTEGLKPLREKGGIFGKAAAGAFPLLSMVPQAAVPSSPIEAIKHPLQGLIRPEATVPQEFAEAHPHVMGFMGAVSSLLSPANIATIGGLSALGGVTGTLASKAGSLWRAAEAAEQAENWTQAAKLYKSAEQFATGSKALVAIHKSVGAIFTAQFAHHLYQQYAPFKKAVDDGDWKEAAGIAGEALPDMVFTGFGIKDIAEAGGRVFKGVKERSAARAQARADVGLQGDVTPPDVKAEVVPPGEVPEDLKPATQPVPQGVEAPGVPTEPEPEPKVEEKPKPAKKAKKAVPQEEPREEPIATQQTPSEEVGVPLESERRTTEGLSPTGEERRTPKLSEIQGPPAQNVLKVINERLKEPDLPERDRAILEAQKQDVIEHPEDSLLLKDQTLAEIRATAPKPEEELQSYADKAIKSPDIKEVSLVGSTIKGKGKDVDLLYDFGDVGLPEDSGQASQNVEDLIEKQNIDLDKYDSFLKADGRFFHLSSGAGRQIVENTEYGKEQAGKPVKSLAKKEQPTAKLAVPEKEVTLRRAEGVPRELPPWVEQGLKESGAKEAQGRWFTDKQELLDWYNKDVGPGAVTKSLKISAKEAEQYRVSNLPEGHPARRFSRDAENEFFIPRELAERAEKEGVPSEPPTSEAPKAETPAERVPTEAIEPEPKERTLPVEEERAATEPSRTEEPSPRPSEALGGMGEEELAGAQPEAVRGTPEERKPEPRGEESGGTDLGRPVEHGEPGLRLSERVGSGEGTVHVPAERGKPAGPRREPGQISSGQRATNDYHITDADEIGVGGIRSKYRGNVSAVRTLKQIEQEGRLATPTEQAQLVKYVGWGGMPQAFDEGNRKWVDEYREIKDLFGDEEYRAARASTPNAHYTSPQVVGAMWDAVRRMGFEQGRMLEPSAGVGHFLGLMPPDLAAPTTKVAIELDPITGRILKQLYQSADARIQGFEKFNGRDGTFDLVVGNVPFGDYKVNDREYNKHNLNIHNYFILKSLDKLRPGGVAALITSSSTLDAADPKARNLFAGKADLVGAIRLPNTAFKGNANTEVTTDILFFKKRPEGEHQRGEPFEHSKALPNGIRVNEYFHDRPEMMLGSMERAGTMYGPDQPALIAPPEQDLPAELQKAVENLPENVLTPFEPPKSTTVEAVADATPAFGETKQYGLKIQKGKVFRKLGDSLSPVADYPAKSVPILKDMLGMRDAVRELFEAEGKDRSKAVQDKLRAKLNQSYDSFTEKHGMIHNPRNERAMQHDPELPLLLSLENYDQKTKTARKADVFFKQTIAPRVPITRVENPKDAMLVSLSEKGRLDFDHMEKITGQSPEELQRNLKSEGLIFHAPDGHWETTDAYLAGDVRKKLAEARDAAERNVEFQDNVKALEAVMPKELKPSEIYARLGSSWIPKEVIKDFVGHILDDPYAARRTDIQHVDTMGLWTMRTPYGTRQNVRATTKWGTPRAPADYLIEQGLNLREPVVYDKDAEGKAVVNGPETLAAQEKLEALNEEFRRWIFEDSPHASELSRIYNEHFNSEVERQWDGSHLSLPGTSFGVTLKPHQRNQIWRNLNGGNQLVAHEVGTGKSYIIVGTAMEMRRLGKARKPLIVVPNNVVEQITGDFRRLYPEANVLMADKQSFETQNRKEFAARVATGDWDSVVMGHSQFGLLPVSDETFQDFVNEQIDAARAMLSEVAREEGKRGPTVKQIEKDIKRWEAKIEARADREVKDDTINFETLGIDALLVDEAHNFKRLWFPTKMGRVPGVPTGDSNRAMDMYLKSRYVSKLNNGSNVVFATGTPISNTMAEMYVMQKYLDEDYLKAHGMQHFDSWAANFGQKVTKLEVRPEDPSKMRQHTRFAKFVNVPELVKMFRRTADIKTVEELGLPRPKLEGGKARLIIAQPSDRIMDYIAELSSRADAIRGKPPSPGGDNMLNITMDGRKAATDFRLIEPGAEDDPGSKVNQAVDKIAQTYNDKMETLGTQLVMLDLGVPTEASKKAGRFNIYDDIKRKLVARGIPANEIRFIQEAKNNEQKQALFDDTNSGKIRVLMGSTPLLGVGVNVQKRLYAIHHLDAPMRPSDIEQRNGRILRQGNMNPEVQENRYVTERTFDSYIWQLLENKAKFTGQVMRGDPTNREMEDVDDFALSAAEIKALSTGNPLIMRKIETDTQLQRLTSLARSHANQQFDNKSRLARIPEEITAVKDTIQKVQADIDKRDSEKPDKFSITIGKSSYPERKEAGAALNEAIIKNAGSNERKAGKFNGFDVWVRGNMDGYVKGENSYFFSLNETNPLGTMQSLEAAVRNMEMRLDNRKLRLEELTKEQEQRKQELDTPFNKQAELEKLMKQKKEIDGQLDIKNRGAGEVATADTEEGERKSGEEGFGTLDMLTFGLPSLYRKIMRAWKRRGGQGEAQESGRTEDTSDSQETPQEAQEREVGVPEEPPGTEPESKAAKPGEKAINIRLDKLNSPDDVIDLIRQTAKESRGRIQFQRRGRLSDAQLKERMEQVGLDPDKLASLPRGKALNEAEIEVAIGIMQSEGQKIRDAAKAVRESNSAENILRAQELHNRYVAIQAAVSGITAEAGRSLRTFRRIHNAVERDDRSGYERVVESLGGRALAEKEAQKLLEIPEDDMIGYYKFLRDHAKFTTAQKLTYYWLNNLLSSPRTIARKLMGDATMVALNVPKTFVRAAIDPLVARAQRRPTEYQVRDAIAQTGAFFGAFPEGIKRAAFVMRNGFEIEDAQEMDLPGRYELPGGYATNFPTRNLAGATAMFKIMHFKSALAGDAMREALRQGLRGRDAGYYAAALTENPPDEMIDNAWKEARKLALVEEPDSFLRAVLRMRNITIPQDYPIVGGLAPLRFVIPFANIGWNIGKMAVRYSPIGAARVFTKAGRTTPEASNYLAEALIGSLILAAFAQYAAGGNVTGAAPKSGAEKDAFYRSGKVPFSIKIAGRWVKYTGAWGIMAPALSAIAAFHDAHVKNGKLPDGKQISEVAAAIGAAATDQPLFRGVQTLMEAITNPQGHSVENFEAEAAAGFIPGSSLLRTTAQAIDPTVRDPQGVYQRIQSGLPFLSQRINPRIDVLGREETHRGGEGAKAFLPSGIPEAVPLSDTDAELARLHEKGLKDISPVGKKLTYHNQKVELSQAETLEYEKLRGGILNDVLTDVFQSDEYKELNDQEKIEMTHRVIYKVEEAARKQMAMQIAEETMTPEPANVR